MQMVAFNQRKRASLLDAFFSPVDPEAWSLQVFSSPSTDSMPCPGRFNFPWNGPHWTVSLQLYIRVAAGLATLGMDGMYCAGICRLTYVRDKERSCLYIWLARPPPASH